MYIIVHMLCHNNLFIEHKSINTRRRNSVDNDSTICALPDEVLLRIFSYLPHSSLLVCLLICRRLNVIATDSSLCKYQ